MQKDTRLVRSPQTESTAPLSASDVLLWDALPELKLNIAQTAALCGISVRQLGYWTKQGYVIATGRGSRRLYGLDSLRRILAIQKAIHSGSSLRQAVRAQAGRPAEPSDEPAVSESPCRIDVDGIGRGLLSSREVDTLTADLLALFQADHTTRDNACGLAIKIGRAEEDVAAVAETLCAQGILTKAVARGDTVFARVYEG